jgi:hypothetical protein
LSSSKFILPFLHDELIVLRDPNIVEPVETFIHTGQLKPLIGSGYSPVGDASLSGPLAIACERFIQS